MNEALTEAIKSAAYLQWEQTGHNNAIDQWYCAEDIASFLEGMQIVSSEGIVSILRTGRENHGYVEFVRQIAFRLFSFANIQDADANWFSAEKLVHNEEWRREITNASSIYKASKNNPSFILQLRSDRVRNYYKAQLN